MVSGYEIRQLDLAGLEAVIGDVIAVRTVAYLEWNGPRTQQEEAQEAASWLRAMADRRNPAAFAARHAGRIVGYLWGHNRDDGEFYISHIGVHPGHQRQGIGRALLQACEGACRSTSYRALTTSTYNRYRGMLILLLQKGFVVQGVTWVSGASEPRLLLRKELV
jgi:GNAT superfamily N-acetyltransferase